MWKKCWNTKEFFLLSSIPLEYFWNFSHYKLLAPTHLVKESCSWLSPFTFTEHFSVPEFLSVIAAETSISPPPTTHPHRTARPAISNKGRVWLRAWERGAGRDLGDVDREPLKGHVGRRSTSCIVVERCLDWLE